MSLLRSIVIVSILSIPLSWGMAWAGTSMEANDVDIRVALDMFAANANVSIVTGDVVHGRVSVRLQDVGRIEGVVAIARLRGYKTGYRAGKLVVGTDDSLEIHGSREIVFLFPVAAHENIEIMKQKAKLRFPKLLHEVSPQLGYVIILKPDVYGGPLPTLKLPSAKAPARAGGDDPAAEPDPPPPSRVGSGGDGRVARLRARIRENPRDGRAYRKLGVVYRKSGKNDLAKKALERAVQLDSEDVGARSHLCLTLLDLGERDEARRQFRAVKRLNPSMAKKLSGMIARRRK